MPTNFTLDLNGATIKVNAFTGAHNTAVGLFGCTDSHLVNGTIEGDYREHDYDHSPNGSEWPLGFCMKGCEYTTVENVTVRDITGYGVSVGGLGFAPKKHSAFSANLKGWTAGGLDPRTGEVAFKDGAQFTSEFVDIAPYRGEKRLQISKYLGYQGRDTRSWQLVVAWYDAEKKFLASETCWQYREMMIPANAAFLRCSIEAGDLAEAKKTKLRLLRFRPSWNCAIRNCTVERARCVGMAPTAMKNMLFEGNLITRSGESKARCAFDAEDGWDQMQDVYFLRNTLKDNPVNNSLLTCCGHNFIFEKTVGGISLHGRTHSSCVRDNDLSYARFCCDSRLRSGYARFSDNRYTGKLSFGNDAKAKGWDFVLSGLAFDKATARNLSVDAGLLFSPYKAAAKIDGGAKNRSDKGGCARVQVDCRGTGGCKGRFVAYRPDTVDDARDVLDAIAAQPWSNGRVVMSGGRSRGGRSCPPPGRAFRTGSTNSVACRRSPSCCYCCSSERLLSLAEGRMC